MTVAIGDRVVMCWAAALAVAMAMTGAAEAAPLGERPFQRLPGGGVAACLHATGASGGLALYRPRGADLLTAGADGVTRQERVSLGRLGSCAEAAVAPSGAAVVAAWQPDGRELRAVVRDPGGRFETPVSIGSSKVFLRAVDVAISPSGHAVVAWAQGRGSRYANQARIRIVAVRRPPGGAFGPVEQLGEWHHMSLYGLPEVKAGIDAAGVATVVWARPLRWLEDLAAVGTAMAAPGAQFVKQGLAGTASSGTSPALVVAPDGWALLAHNSWGGTFAYEREPGATRFRRLASVPRDVIQGTPAVAVREGGGGIVAWRTDPYLPTAGLRAVVRAGPGPFGLPQDVAEQPGISGSAVSRTARHAEAPPPDPGRADLAAAVAPDGRALLAWTVRRPGPIRAMTTHVASGSLAEGFGAPAPLGGALRDVNSLVPLFLPDGRAALAWTDNTGLGADARPSAAGRIHFALEGAPARRQPAPPQVTLSARRSQRVYPARSPRVLAECDRPCDLRVLVAGELGYPSLTLRANRPARLPLPTPYEGLPSGAVRVPILVSALGATRVTQRSVRFRWIRRAPRPAHAPLDVRAERDGTTIVVRWRSAAPARATSYEVTGLLRRSVSNPPLDPRARRTVNGAGRTRFVTRLPDARGVRWVWVLARGVDDGRWHHEVIARVR